MRINSICFFAVFVLKKRQRHDEFSAPLSGFMYTAPAENQQCAIV
jgi:hypothetical protein